MEEFFISCYFSFTIKRDKWGIPSMIVGNFIHQDESWRRGNMKPSPSGSNINL